MTKHKVFLCVDDVSSFDLETAFVLIRSNILLTFKKYPDHTHLFPLCTYNIFKAGGLEPATEAPDPGERVPGNKGEPRLEEGVEVERTLSRTLQGGKETVFFDRPLLCFQSS